MSTISVQLGSFVPGVHSEQVPDPTSHLACFIPQVASQKAYVLQPSPDPALQGLH